MFTHFVIGTQESRNARMRAYERVHGLCQPGESDVTAFEIASQETYIVQANRRLRTRYDEITVTTLPDGNVVGMYVTGEADVFTIRDVKHRGKLQVQLVPHLSSVRHTERRTWRLLTAQSTVEHLVWSHGEDTEICQSEIWHAAPFDTTRNTRSSTTRSRIETTVAARPPLAFHTRPRKRKRNRNRKRNGCCCGNKACTTLRAHTYFGRRTCKFRRLVRGARGRHHQPCQIGLGTPPSVLPLVKQGRQLREPLNRWVNHQHSVAVQAALNTTRTDLSDESRKTRFSMVH